jgi:hypothetical protein
MCAVCNASVEQANREHSAIINELKVSFAHLLEVLETKHQTIITDVGSQLPTTPTIFPQVQASNFHKTAHTTMGAGLASLRELVYHSMADMKAIVEDCESTIEETVQATVAHDLCTRIRVSNSH